MKLPWSKVVVWGPGWNLDSLRHTFFAYRDAARKLGLEAINVPDAPESRDALGPGVLCIAADVWSEHIGAAVPGTDYVFHNVAADHVVRQTVDDRNWISLQVWTNAAEGYSGERWGDVRLFHDSRQLIQPWGSKALAEEMHEPIFSNGSDRVIFVGARWDDRGLGNEATIAQLERLVERRRLRFEHHTQIGLSAMIEITRSARLAPAFAGGWQVEHDYLPCRCFDHPAWGILCVTNVPRMRALFDGAHVKGDSLEELVDAALGLSSRDYIAMVKAQQAVVAKWTYRESLESIARAFEIIRP